MAEGPIIPRKLVLGVLDVAYSGDKGSTTTGDVAEILESEYHPMRIFAEEYQYRIGQALADALSDSIQDMANGAPPAPDPFFEATQQIEGDFRRFITTQEIERINPELPTQAALEGRSKRRKRTKGPRRPSLVDTGAYIASMRAWVEGESEGNK